jgi:hypothetical protein
MTKDAVLTVVMIAISTVAAAIFFVAFSVSKVDLAEAATHSRVRSLDFCRASMASSAANAERDSGENPEASRTTRLRKSESCSVIYSLKWNLCLCKS